MNKFYHMLKYILILSAFVLVFIIFSWWGVFGYIAFVLLIAAYIIVKRKDEYIAIVDYGANELRKVFKHGRKKTK